MLLVAPTADMHADELAFRVGGLHCEVNQALGFRSRGHAGLEVSTDECSVFPKKLIVIPRHITF